MDQDSDFEEFDQEDNFQITSPKAKAAPKKRKSQVNSACTFCKRRHIKCNGENPCAQCKTRNQECVYAKPQKRGRKAVSSLNNKKKEVYWESKYIDSQKEIDELKLALIKANQHLPAALQSSNVISFEYGNVYLNKFVETVLPVFPTIKVHTINEKFLKEVQVGDSLDELCEAFESSVVLAHGACTMRSREDATFLTKQAEKYYDKIHEIVDGKERILNTEKPQSKDVAQKVIDSTILLQYLWACSSYSDAVKAHDMGVTAYKVVMYRYCGVKLNTSIFKIKIDNVSASAAKRLFAGLATYSLSNAEKSKYLQMADLDNIYQYGDEGTLIHDVLLLSGVFATSLISAFTKPPANFDMHLKVLEALEKTEVKMEFMDIEKTTGLTSDNVYFYVWVLRGFLYFTLGKIETAEFWIAKALPLLPVESLITEKYTVSKDKYLVGMFPKFDSLYAMFKQTLEEGSLASPLETVEKTKSLLKTVEETGNQYSNPDLSPFLDTEYTSSPQGYITSTKSPDMYIPVNSPEVYPPISSPGDLFAPTSSPEAYIGNTPSPEIYPQSNSNEQLFLQEISKNPSLISSNISQAYIIPESKSFPRDENNPTLVQGIEQQNAPQINTDPSFSDIFFGEHSAMIPESSGQSYNGDSSFLNNDPSKFLEFLLGPSSINPDAF